MGTQRRRRALKAAATRPPTFGERMRRIALVALQRLVMRAVLIGVAGLVAAATHAFPVPALAYMYVLFLVASYASDVAVAVVQWKLAERRARRVAAAARP